MAHSRYKYDGSNSDFPTNLIGVNIRKNPNQIGMYVEETHTVAVSGANFYIDCDNYLATELHTDFVITSFATGHTSFGSAAGVTAYGIVYVINATGPVYLTALVDFVGWSGKRLTFNATNIAANDILTIGYYAIGVGYKTFAGASQPEDILLRPDFDKDNAYHITKENIQCLVRAMDVRSPIDLPKLGYKWAHIFAVNTEEGEYDDKTVLDTSATVGDGTPDYIVDYDTYLPFFVTELRVMSQHKNITLFPNFQGELAAPFDMVEFGNARLLMSNSSLCYRTSSSSTDFLLSAPLGLCQTKQFKINATSTTAVGKTRYVISAWYRPKVASHMVV